MRIYPHLQDSGGFFIAVLERKRRQVVDIDIATEAAPSTDKQKRPVPDEDDVEDESAVASKRAKLTPKGFGEEDMQVDEPILPGNEQKAMDATEAGPVDKKHVGKQTTGHFKENPFTFIPADEPGVLGCMYVSHFSFMPMWRSVFPFTESGCILVRTSRLETSSSEIPLGSPCDPYTS